MLRPKDVAQCPARWFNNVLYKDAGDQGSQPPPQREYEQISEQVTVNPALDIIQSWMLYNSTFKETAPDGELSLWSHRTQF